MGQSMSEAGGRAVGGQSARAAATAGGRASPTQAPRPEATEGRARRSSYPLLLAYLTGLALALGALGCGTSHTQASNVGPFVRSLKLLGPTAFVEECTVEYFETTSHDVNPFFLFFAFFSIETPIVTSDTSSRLASNHCASSSFALSSSAEPGGPGAAPPLPAPPLPAPPLPAPGARP